jgi:hypothetical protein
VRRVTVSLETMNPRSASCPAMSRSDRMVKVISDTGAAPAVPCSPTAPRLTLI